MEAYPEAVRKVLDIYLKKAVALPKKEQKVFVITGMFTYLSTAEVKPLLNTPFYAKLRPIVLTKIHEFSNDAYVRKKENHRLRAVMHELFTYLVQDDSVPRRRSERQKQDTVRDLNSCFDHCDSIGCRTIATELKKWSAVKPPSVSEASVSEANAKPAVSIRVKVLPRRSARLLAKKE